MTDNQQVDLKIDKETYDALQMLKEVLPSEDSDGKMDDGELLKMIIGTFMSFVMQPEEGEEWHEHGGCDCGEWHCNS